VVQPFDDGTDLRDFFHAVASGTDFMTLRIVVAWAKRSGMRRAAGDLGAVRDRGGKVLAIVGVSEGGATEQGLNALLNQTDESHVFHDAGRTFHPKVYLAEADDRALLLVGSNNLTAGGLAWNYEAGLWCELDLGVEAERRVRDDVVAYFERLKADAAVCLPLDTTTLASMVADTGLIIQNEDSVRRAEKPEPDAPEDTDSNEPLDDEPVPHVFGKSSLPKRKAPAVVPLTPRKAPARKVVPPVGAVFGSPAEREIVKRWFKQMNRSDAQQRPNPNTNPTGVLRLSQEDFAIDHTRYFHEVFFAGSEWTPTARDASIDELWLPMQTVVDGEYLGDVNIRISYGAKRIADQGNVSTVLHWGDLALRMRENNYQGMYVTLERAVGSTFDLTISGAPTGDFRF
jgi:PLD-like domain